MYIWLFSLSVNYCAFIDTQVSSAFYQAVILLLQPLLLIRFYLS